MMKLPNKKKDEIKKPVTQNPLKDKETIPPQAAKGDDDLMSQQQPK